MPAESAPVYLVGLTNRGGKLCIDPRGATRVRDLLMRDDFGDMQEDRQKVWRGDGFVQEVPVLSIKLWTGERSYYARLQDLAQ